MIPSIPEPRGATIKDPIEALLEEANKYLGEIEKPNLSNKSIRINYWLQETGVPIGLPWCAAYVTGVGRQALGHAWPVIFSASVQRIVDWAISKDVLQDTPVKGDLFVIYFSRLKRFGHIGIVTDIGQAGSIKTIEGNTNPGGSRDGWGVFKRDRKVTANYKFIRWVSLV
jgi:hypothetical protein